MGVDYESFEATARADFDVRGHMIPGAPPSSFQSVTIDMKIVSDAPAQQLREIERLSLEGCPGVATLRNPVAVHSSLAVTRPGATAVAAE